MSKSVVVNPWHTLKAFTDARIALGRAGSSIPTHEMLKFQLNHAQARDAVHLPLDAALLFSTLEEELNDYAQTSELFSSEQPLLLNSLADTRGTYLQRPDLGRQLNQASCHHLSNQAEQAYDLAICIVDGLSSTAIERNASAFLQALLKIIKHTNIHMAPLSICTQGRVAIGDQVAQLLNAKTIIVLIGERPGLLSPDSMGLYLTFNAKVGCNDAQRNCISNIRPAGLSYQEAAHKTQYLMTESTRLGLSGVSLKERSDPIKTNLHSQKNFLVKTKN